MKKNTKVEPVIQTTLSERLNDHPILVWVSQNTRNLIYLLLVIVAITILTYRLLNYWSSKAGYHYLLASTEFSDIQQNSNAQPLIELLQKQPDLQAKYDGLLAQILLIQGHDKEAEPLITRALQRTKDLNHSLYTRYAETTLLIAQKNYEDALKQATDLKQDSHENPILFPLNLLRIAMLQRQLGLTEQELATWEEWKEHASDYQQVAQIFTVGNTDLNNYIESRENIETNVK